MTPTRRLEPEFLLDTVAINAKYRKRREDPRRQWTGTTQVDADCQGEMLKRRLYEVTNRFLIAMQKRDWELYSKVHITGPFRAYDFNSALPILGKVEYHLRATFKLTAPLRPLPLEIPTGLIKRDPEHTITLRDALRAH